MYALQLIDQGQEEEQEQALQLEEPLDKLVERPSMLNIDKPSSKLE